jgi:hypothetical protein
MDHRPILELQAIADVEAHIPLTQERRLDRWVGLLQAHPGRELRSLHEIEHLSATLRRQCRAANSPLTVAYEDPILRSAGLRSDSVGDCTEFFELSDEQMHHAFCSCHVGATLTGLEAAERLRRVMRSATSRKGMTSALWSTITHAFRLARKDGPT